MFHDSLRAICAVAIAFALGCNREIHLPRSGVLTINENQIQAVFSNPDPSVWKESTLDVDNPRPELKVYMLRRLPIKDKNGVPVKPVLSILLFELPNTEITTTEFYISKSSTNPIKVERMDVEGAKLVSYGTITYDGVVHKVIRAAEVKENVGMIVICDSYETTYSKVEADFKTWLKGALLTVRSTRTPPVLISALSQPLAFAALLGVSPQAGPVSSNRWAALRAAHRGGLNRHLGPARSTAHHYVQRGHGKLPHLPGSFRCANGLPCRLTPPR